MKNILIVHTGSGASYAKKIASSVNWMATHLKKKVKPYITSVNGIQSIIGSGLAAADTIIHPRAAYPTENGWVADLRAAERAGYRVVNSVDTIRLTSDKLACALALQDHVAHPRTWQLRRGFTLDELHDVRLEALMAGHGEMVAKPVVSMEQGAQVIQFDTLDSAENLVPMLNNITGETIILQERVPYVALHRVIVIGGHALPYSFVDAVSTHPDNWKVSCCLNRTTMRFSATPDSTLITLAEEVQRLVHGQISFVDVFETADGFVVSEVNTACNLSIHEGLARAAGRTDWNIHYRIARFLTEVK